MGASALGSPNNLIRTAKNGLALAYRAVYPASGTGEGTDAFTAPFTIAAGSPVVALPENTDGCSVIPPFPGGEFRGVLLSDLPYDTNGGQTSRLVLEGVIRANIYIPTASAAVKGATLVMMNGAFSLGFACFKVQANATSPFRLLEDLTTQSDGDFLLVGADGGALIEIEPHAHKWWQAVPATQDADYYFTGAIAAAGAQTLLKEFPDVPRNVRTVSDGATTSAYNMTFAGYSVTGEAISEVVVVSTTNTTITPGTKIFARVTSATAALPDASTVTDLGFGLLFQLPKTSNGKPHMIDAYADATREGTAPAFTVDADEIEKNSISFNTAPDASKNLACTFV